MIFFFFFLVDNNSVCASLCQLSVLFACLEGGELSKENSGKILSVWGSEVLK